MTDDLARQVAEELLRLAVDQLDETVSTDDHDRVGCGFQETGKRDRHHARRGLRCCGRRCLLPGHAAMLSYVALLEGRTIATSFSRVIVGYRPQVCGVGVCQAARM